MGLGLFAAQRIVVKTSDQKHDVHLFVFGGPFYKSGFWNKIVPKHRFPAIRKYAIAANRHTREWAIANGKEVPPLMYIDGNTYFGNVAGYINSSKGTSPPAANALWEERDGGTDISTQRRISGFVQWQPGP